ncbi:universal stress protein [Actinacidiphila glaucinigra]|uniref:universal stress protein n=1 Tax=Actinacidiphila glaucinigra TaxID=235986 RepID=UPI00371B2D2C
MSGTWGPRPIVVGVDPDPARRSALTWAADEAALRNLPLTLVHAQGVPTAGYTSGEVLPSWERWNAALHVEGERLLERAVAYVGSRQPRVAVSTQLVEGHPAWVVREMAPGAAMVVLGSWRLGAVQELFTSASVALPVIAHAPCPVVVVPEPEETDERSRYLVVGVDGHPRSTAAVGLAFQEAALHGAALRALYVWHPPLLGVLDEGAAERECRRLLSESVVGHRAAYPEVDLTQEVVRGHPVEALTQVSERACALVVGTRGQGGFSGLLMGSVSQGVLHHARCPVITVPPSGTAAA